MSEQTDEVVSVPIGQFPIAGWPEQERRAAFMALWGHWTGKRCYHPGCRAVGRVCWAVAPGTITIDLHHEPPRSTLTGLCALWDPYPWDRQVRASRRSQHPIRRLWYCYEHAPHTAITVTLDGAVIVPDGWATYQWEKHTDE